jgi:hypothetical protein
MYKSCFSTLKIAVVTMMLVWAVRYAHAVDYPLCNNPVNSSGYSACMSQCAAAAPVCTQGCNEEYPCGEACAGGSSGCGLCTNNYATCVYGCKYTFDSCATSCYYNYCI